MAKQIAAVNTTPPTTHNTARLKNGFARKQKRISNILESIGIHTIMIVMCFVSVFPLALIILTSFKPENDIFTTGVQLLPPHPTLSNYIHVLTDNNGIFLTWTVNSLK